MSRHIHCPACQVRLAIAREAPGVRVRCPGCGHVFPLPDPSTVLDETVMSWLDLDRMTDDDDEPEVESVDKPGKSAEPPDARESPASSAKPPVNPAPREPVAGQSKPLPSEVQHNAPPVNKPTTPPSKPAPVKGHDDPAFADQLSLDEAMADFERKGTSHGSFVASGFDTSIIAAPAPSKNRQKPSGQRKATPSEPARNTAAHQEKTAEAAEAPKPAMADSHSLDRNEDAGRGRELTVERIGSSGVRFSFPAGMFMLTGFRASMPLVCVGCGKTDVSSLIARPLIWADRLTRDVPEVGDIDTRYQIQLRDQQSPRDVIESMRPMEEFRSPFNQPLPYYVCHQCAPQMKIECRTVERQSGLSCELTLPLGRFALDWLGRVNGVCGDDHEALESAVMRLETSGWRSIPSQVRRRLTVWFDFEPDEQFVGYLNDGDFARSDAGLGGMVITDRRLVYCKYHHHGQVRLADGGEIHARLQGAFADLRYQREKGGKRLIRLRREDLAALASILRQLSAPIKLRLQKAESAVQ
jgi:hypothetical protein